MKIMLIYPLDVELNSKFSSAIFPPLGLLYLASVIRQNGHEVKVIDGFVECVKRNYDYRELKKDIIDFRPDVIGVTALSSQFKNVIKTLQTVKEINQNIITIIGGPHITAVPEHLKIITFADYGIYGEGENTFMEFINVVNKNKSKLDLKAIKKILGMIYRENGEIKFSIRKPIKNIDKLPLPSWDLVPMELYQPAPSCYRKLPSIAIITSRGCPYQCVFCHKPIFGNLFRPHSAKRVVDEIEMLNKKYGINDFRIYDDTFTLDKKRVIEICDLILKRKLNISWNCTTRVNTIDFELLKKMKLAGCYNISFGVESGSERILKLMKKGITKNQVRNAFKWCKKLKIETVAFFILGFPTETYKEIKKTIKFSKELKPDYVEFSLVTPHFDTELYSLCKKYGQVNIDEWSNFKTHSVNSLPFISNSISERKLKFMYKWAYFSFYLNPFYIFKKLKECDLKRLIRGLSVIINR